MSLTFGEAYPEIAYGEVNDTCLADNHCRDGLYCLPSKEDSRKQSCQIVSHHLNSEKTQGVNENPLNGCQRTPFDQRCHRILNNGHKGICPESECIKELAPSFKPVPEYQCEGASTYFHKPTHNTFCVYIDEHTGVPNQVPDKCCDRLAISDLDLPNQLIRDGFHVEMYRQFN
jgi:hypothetical protein